MSTRLLFAVSSPVSAYYFLRGQLNFLKERGFTVFLASSDDGAVKGWAREQGATFLDSGTVRQPSVRRDLVSVRLIAGIILSVKPKIVVYGTPKAALLFGLISRILRVKHRIYLVHGLRYEGYHGWLRRLFILIEQLICSSSTRIVCVSESVRDRVVEDVQCDYLQTIVLGSGSPNGVDQERFSIATFEERERARASFGLSSDSVVVSFIGRLNPDKGLPLLPELALALECNSKDVCLLIAGEAEGKGLEAAQILSNSAVARLVGQVPDVERVYWASDVVVLPTKREGLPTVLIEAGACGVPVVASKVTGCVDVVVDGVNGKLVEGNDAHEWAHAIDDCLAAFSTPESARAIRESAISRFSSQHVWSNWGDLLNSLK